MMNALRNNVQHMIDQELERSRAAMQWGGLIGLLAHPIYYFVWTYLLPQPYDNLYLRLSAALFSIPPILQKYWPKRFNNYLLALWHFALIYALPFVCTFLAIKNSFSTMWMMTEVMMIFIMALCINIPLLLMSYIVIGFISAFIAVNLTSDEMLVLTKTDKSNLALLPVVMLCSMVFSITMQKGRALADKTRALTTLAGSIALDMRNPLGQMKFALECISGLLPTPSTSHASQKISTHTVNDIYSNIAQGLNSCKRGLQVIDITLHEVSNHELNPEKFEYLSAVTVTAKALDEYGFDTPDERKRVHIQTRTDFVFKVDETAYIYIIFNIIKNALYYFKQYPNAEITITVSRQIITITDTGPGIPAPIFSRLFREFTTAGKSNGTGLGLAYCQRTMQTFNGEISCETVLGQYTTFTLSFPMIQQNEIEEHTNEVFRSVAPFIVHRRILVVDDEPIYATTVHHMLYHLGCTIDAAENGDIAIDMLRTRYYDLIILDLNMPVKDGYNTAVEIRSGAVPLQKNIPIIAHTSEPHYMAKIKTEKVGMDGFINKQCSPLELITVIYKALNSVQQRLAPAKSETALAGKTILITDDELFNRQYMEIYVTEWGMKTLHADSGQAAIDMLKQNPAIDFVSMDMRMPDMSGIETAARIRADPANRGIFIVAVTGDCSEQLFEEAKAAGISDLIIKPIDKVELKQKLTRLVACHHN